MSWVLRVRAIAAGMIQAALALMLAALAITIIAGLLEHNTTWVSGALELVREMDMGRLLSAAAGSIVTTPLTWLAARHAQRPLAARVEALEQAQPGAKEP